MPKRTPHLESDPDDPPSRAQGARGPRGGGAALDQPRTNRPATRARTREQSFRGLVPMTMSYTNLQPTELACGRTGTERVGTEGKGALPIARSRPRGSHPRRGLVVTKWAKAAAPRPPRPSAARRSPSASPRCRLLSTSSPSCTGTSCLLRRTCWLARAQSTCSFSPYGKTSTLAW